MTDMHRKGGIFIIIGPSGSGKGSVIKKLLEDNKNLYLSVSATTRSPRPGETHGKDYHFVSREEFLQMIEEKSFLEYAEYVGNYYGTPLKPIIEAKEKGMNVIIEIEVQGAMQVKKILPEANMIFIVPPSIEILEQRLRNRGTETEEKIIKRLKRAREEYLLARNFDYLVVNSELENAKNEILDIIKVESYRPHHRMDYLEI